MPEYVNYNPDVLSCLANLSNDEVFTPPEIVNAMLDMIPQELFEDPNAKFLDPACKTGVFLREIAKRLLKGLEKKIPNLQERIDHIFHEQLYAIAITELTALMSRRSVYCSKAPDSVYSVTPFENKEGNIRFRRTQHSWDSERKDAKCVYCGASREQFDRGIELETHAYEFIHKEDIYKMKFDLIISNPPYQMSFGIEGTNSANAKSIYNFFIEQAIKLKPRYLLMITPSRWMTKTAQGIPEEWVEKMLSSNQIKVMRDFENASDCFPGVQIKGGVNYFLWERDYNGKCHYSFQKATSKEVLSRYDFLDSKRAGIVIRDPQAYSIIEKVENIEGTYFLNADNNFSGLVSPKHFFDNSDLLTSNWNGYSLTKHDDYEIKYYLNKTIHQREFGYIRLKDIPKNSESRKQCKVYISAAYGAGENFPHQIIGKPFIGESNSICSQTYLVIGYDSEKHNFTLEECKNIISYIETKFFRYLVSLKKKTQNGPRGVYQFVPLQDFKYSWSDEKLFKKYHLSDDEINVIESRIKDMKGED